MNMNLKIKYQSLFSIIMVSKKRPKKAKLNERQFVLRLPEYQAAFLDHLVELGMFKSLNASIVQIITVFITDLERSAKKAKKVKK